MLKERFNQRPRSPKIKRKQLEQKTWFVVSNFRRIGKVYTQNSCVKSFLTEKIGFNLRNVAPINK